MIDRPRCHERDCINLRGVTKDVPEIRQRPICLAFPEGIPSDIAYGDDLHLNRDPRQDNAFVFTTEEDIQ